MGLMQWDTTQQERQPQYILGFRTLSTGFRYHWYSSWNTVWNAIKLGCALTQFMVIEGILWLGKSEKKKIP